VTLLHKFALVFVGLFLGWILEVLKTIALLNGKF